jgi:hypothetical protein
MRRLLLLLPLLLFAACSSDEDFTPTTPPGPSIPTIGGTYNSPTMWQLNRTRPGGPEQFVCAGGITIANQIGTNFSGTYFIADANCASGVISGSLVGGTLETDGSVSFELTLGSESPFMSAVFGCTYVSGDRIVNGTIVNNQLTAESRTVMDCSDGQNTLVMRLSGTR